MKVCFEFVCPCFFSCFFFSSGYCVHFTRSHTLFLFDRSMYLETKDISSVQARFLKRYNNLSGAGPVHIILITMTHLQGHRRVWF